MVLRLKARDDLQEATVPLEPPSGIMLGDNPPVLLPLLVGLSDFGTPLVDLAIVRFGSSEMLFVVDSRRGRRTRRRGEEREEKRREGSQQWNGRGCDSA